jgi:hypothetical protein
VACQVGRGDLPREIDKILTPRPLNVGSLSIPYLGRRLKKVVYNALPPGPLLRRLGSLLDLLLHHLVGGRWVVEAGIAKVWVFELFGQRRRRVKPQVTISINLVPFH